MSDSHKARYGTNCKLWKDTLHQSRCHARSRSLWKALGRRAERRTGEAGTKVRHLHGTVRPMVRPKFEEDE